MKHLIFIAILATVVFAETPSINGESWGVDTIVVKHKMHMYPGGAVDTLATGKLWAKSRVFPSGYFKEWARLIIELDDSIPYLPGYEQYSDYDECDYGEHTRAYMDMYIPNTSKLVSYKLKRKSALRSDLDDNLTFFIDWRRQCHNYPVVKSVRIVDENLDTITYQIAGFWDKITRVIGEEVTYLGVDTNYTTLPSPKIIGGGSHTLSFTVQEYVEDVVSIRRPARVITKSRKIDMWHDALGRKSTKPPDKVRILFRKLY